MSGCGVIEVKWPRGRGISEMDTFEALGRQELAHHGRPADPAPADKDRGAQARRRLAGGSAQ